MTLFIVFLTMSFNVFALKIPTGDNIRAADAKLDGESIIEVVIGGEQPAEITTPIGKVKAKVGSTIYFYKSGALKQVTLDYDHYKNDNNEPLTTEIGTINFCGGCELNFYESGSVESFYTSKSTCITVSGIKYGVRDSRYDKKYQICFYDSGAKDKFLPKSIYATPYKNEEGNTIYSVTFKNKSGTFDISLGSDLRPNDWDSSFLNCIEFYKDGSIKSGYLKSSPNDLAKVNGSEVFISSDSNISFYEDGSIASFTSDELCMTTQGGIKLVIPAKTNIELYENGIVKNCECSNQVTVKQTTYTYQGREHSSEKNIFVKFNKDGSIRALNNTHDSDYDMTWIDTFYSDGSKKRIVENRYDYHSGHYYVSEIILYYPQGDKIKGYSEYKGQDYIHYIYYTLNEKGIAAYLQKGDKYEDLGMIYFDDTGKPSSYSLLKRDKDGKPICDEFGFPLFEETRKRFIYK